MNREILQEFKQMLLLVDWDSVTILQDSKVACNSVLEVFSGFCDIAFPKQNTKLKIKYLKDPGNQKAFKGVPKKSKNYTKMSCKKKRKQ